MAGELRKLGLWAGCSLIGVLVIGSPCGVLFPVLWFGALLGFYVSSGNLVLSIGLGVFPYRDLVPLLGI